ncbi:hypothetical protein QFZ55_008103 [Streptomyces luteogriseus]|uniref:hypothetical protein n=1 Tax=Streptomyces luteogriseus TaxID=68233 RepID=UPI00277E8808|nr:hypothetical protein [Streptomyces luteogriseus]MDQ0718651.1 hypothetical protein [Streptomyces luteogriseus]
MTLMNLLVDFAQTGRIGPLHCGMPLSEAEALLGPGRPHPAIRMRGPDIDGYPYAWDGLELATAQRLVSEICIRLSPGSTTKLPPLVLPESESYPSTVLREDLIAGLDAVGCGHDVNDRLTFGQQSSILTRPAGVCAVFFPPGRGDHMSLREHHCLGVIHNHTA